MPDDILYTKNRREKGQDFADVAKLTRSAARLGEALSQRIGRRKYENRLRSETTRCLSGSIRCPKR